MCSTLKRKVDRVSSRLGPSENADGLSVRFCPKESMYHRTEAEMMNKAAQDGSGTYPKTPCRRRVDKHERRRAQAKNGALQGKKNIF